MNVLHAEYSDVIFARPEAIYAVLSDYEQGHPAILPRQYFTELAVEQGGQGAGTIIRGALNVWGTAYRFRQLVSEPEPGHILVETDLDNGQVTTFIVEALDNGQRTRVTIASDFPVSPGLIGLSERWIKPTVTRHIYAAQLVQLAAYVEGR